LLFRKGSSALKILDKLDEIAKVDRSDMLSFCVEAPEHYRQAAELAENLSIEYPKPDSIVVAGMGGSGIGGDLLKDWARDRVSVPIEVCKEYSLPISAYRRTLIIAVSYSGETEETLSVLLDALKKKCMIISIGSGGKLHEFAGKMGFPHLLVPAGMAPRATLPYLFIPLLSIMQKIGLVSEVDNETSETFRVLKEISMKNSPRKLSAGNPSKQLAFNILGTVPAVYGHGIYRTVAQRIKTQINENSKNPAKWETLPELDHNEIVGWEEAAEYSKCLSAIFIRDENEPTEVLRRIEVTKDLMSRNIKRIFEIRSSGKSCLAKMASAICIGDFMSVYLAILRGVDPTPVKTITLLKSKLEQTGFKKNVLRELQKLASR
jgi:glucose/mannose-6-phosphate isomerase